MQNWPRSSPRGRACTKRCVCVVTAKRHYSEDVPALERDRHAEFESSRINTQNFRKEFFRIPIATIHAGARRLVFTDIEAQEY